MNDNYFDEAMTYGSMRRALKRCCRGIRWKDSVVGYELHAAQHTHELLSSIRNGTYKISPYQHFTIYEPKKREIIATRIADRQVQMALCMGGWYEDITEHFIYDNCACQTGKGTDFALNRLKVHLLQHYREHGKDGWVLKCDIHHFFPSTRHDVAKAAVAKRTRDPKAAQMVYQIIDSFGGDRGIGLGSQISQLVELAVLDNLDHYIKERLHIRHYIRYMDDFLLIHPDKEYLRECLRHIRAEVEKIGLALNDKTTIYPVRQGICFLQWRFLLTDTGGVRMLIGNDKAGRERRRLKKVMAREVAGGLPIGTADNSFTAWKANAERGDAYFTIRDMKRYYQRLKGEMQHGYDPGTTAQNPARRMAGPVQGEQQRGEHRLYRHDGRHRNSY